MIVYLDNDALLKLVAWDLLNEALAVMGATRKDVRILAAAEYVLRRKRKKPEYGGEGTFSRLDQILPNLTRVTDEPDGYSELVAVDSMDAGEGILIGHVAATPAAYLTTGDKRCLKALLNPTLADFRRGLAAKVLCVEGAIEALITQRGFEFVRDRVIQCLACDAAVRAVFGLGRDARQDSVLEGLRQYLSELPQDLLFRPPSSHPNQR